MFIMRTKLSRCFLIVLCFLAYFSAPVAAQDTTFMVLAENGSVMIKAGEEWMPLSTGTSLTDKDIIKMDEGAYLGLIHISGETTSIEEAGTYEVSRLSAGFGNKQPGMAAKYAELYLQSVQSGGMQNQQAIAPPAAVAERGTQSSKLKVLLPNSVDVFSPKVILKWNDKDTVDRSYEVVFKNMFDEVIMTKETDNTKLMLDFAEQKIARERLVIVSVNAKQHKEIQSSNYGIKQLSPEASQQIEKELAELKLDISDKESALDKLILASFYEQNNLLADALTNYEYAIALEPEVQAFKIAYDQFIFRNGLDY